MAEPLVRIEPASSFTVEIHGKTYTLTSPSLGDCLAPIEGEEGMSDGERLYAFSIRLVWSAMHANHPEVTEGWLRTVFTANNGDALGTIVAALRGNSGGEAEDSEVSP